jgi:hypothetical protein
MKKLIDGYTGYTVSGYFIFYSSHGATGTSVTFVTSSFLVQKRTGAQFLTTFG